MPLTLGLVGGGVVGGGIVEMLRSNPDIKFAKICVRDKSKKRDYEVPAGCTIVSEYAEVVNDPAVDVVVEVMGGTGLAKEVTLKALQSGKSVVSANKALISKHMAEIEANAAPTNTKGGQFLYEAAVCGGIPIINTFLRGLAGDKIKSLSGIMNGTTNFILSKMEKEGAGYEATLKEAQDLGFAEADPAADVEGWDARSKLVILARLAFGVVLDEEKVPCIGISRISAEDFQYAKMAGKTIRIIGSATLQADGKVAAWVSPVLVPETSALAAILGPTNCIQVLSEKLGISTYSGAGAGRFPTANSCVGDILDLAAGKRPSHPYGGKVQAGTLADDFEAEFYMRFIVCDQLGILNVLTGRMAEAGISVFSILQIPITDKNRVPFCILTEKCKHSQTVALLKLLQGVSFMTEDPVILPVLETSSSKL